LIPNILNINHYPLSSGNPFPGRGGVAPPDLPGWGGEKWIAYYKLLPPGLGEGRDGGRKKIGMGTLKIYLPIINKIIYV